MKAASKSSKGGVAPSGLPPDPERARALERRRERREWYRLFAPPDVRHRRGEARRWLDELAVRTTNGRVCERRPGQRLFDTVAERVAVADALLDALGRDDPELLRAVERLQFEDRTRDMGITLEEWKVRAHYRWERISKVRAEMQRAGLV